MTRSARIPADLSHSGAVVTSEDELIGEASANFLDRYCGVNDTDELPPARFAADLKIRHSSGAKQRTCEEALSTRAD